MDSWTQSLISSFGGEIDSFQSVATAKAMNANRSDEPTETDLMHTVSFNQAKITASSRNKWLIIKVQSHREFNSQAWANEAVAETVEANFIFWQIYKDVPDGRKVRAWYHLDKFPAVLVIDPVSGQKLREWYGAIDPNDFLEDLCPYLDSSPKDTTGATTSSSSHTTQGTVIKISEINEIEQALFGSSSVGSLKTKTEVKSKEELEMEIVQDLFGSSSAGSLNTKTEVISKDEVKFPPWRAPSLERLKALDEELMSLPWRSSSVGRPYTKAREVKSKDEEMSWLRWTTRRSSPADVKPLYPNLPQ